MPGTADVNRSRRARGASSVGQLFRRAAELDPASEVVFPSERLTLARLNERADQIAALLLRLGVEPGDRIGVLLPPIVDYIAAIAGAARIGAIVVPISDRSRVAELTYLVLHAELSVVLTAPGNDFRDFPADLVRGLPNLGGQGPGPLHLRDAPRLRHVVLVGGTAPLPPFLPTPTPGEAPEAEELAAVLAREQAIVPSDPVYLMYTSGTSAAPKGCVISHDAVLRQADSIARTRYLLGPGDAFWCPLPLFHNGCLATMTACLASGAKFVHAGVFDPGIALQMLEEERCTHAIPAFETIWLPVLDHPQFPTTDLSALRVVLNAGTSENLRQLQARLPDVIQVANYGITEATGHVSINYLDDPLEIRLTTGGRPLPDMQVRVVDRETGADLPADDIGEILFRGVSRFSSYFKDPQATADAIDADGWFRSGDLGRLDAEGRLTYEGRVKDMLKVGGENVSALELETYLRRHPAVNIATVVAAPDGYYGEVAAAYVQLAPGRTASEQELIEYCLGQIATFKVPRYVRFVKEWPMSGTKIQKFALRERIAAEIMASGRATAPRLRVTGAD